MNVVEFRELVFASYGGLARTSEVTQLALFMLYQKHTTTHDEKTWYMLLAAEIQQLRDNAPRTTVF